MKRSGFGMSKSSSAGAPKSGMGNSALTSCIANSKNRGKDFVYYGLTKSTMTVPHASVTVNPSSSKCMMLSSAESKRGKKQQNQNTVCGGTTRTSGQSSDRKGPWREPQTSHPTVEFPDNPNLIANLEFYRNKIASKPYPGTKIEDMLQKWPGDYHKLEYEHQYIQWLFPLPEGKGLNWSAQALQQHEALTIGSDMHTRLRVLRAYKMMLGFYGITLVSSNTGEVRRAENYRERFQHLNGSWHNYRRITRIIKSIGYLGYGHMQTPLVQFIINEAIVQKTLPKLNGESMHHWIDAIAHPKAREETMHLFLSLTNQMTDLINIRDSDVDMRPIDVGGNSREPNVDHPTNQDSGLSCSTFASKSTKTETNLKEDSETDTNTGNQFSSENPPRGEGEL